MSTRAHDDPSSSESGSGSQRGQGRRRGRWRTRGRALDGDAATQLGQLLRGRSRDRALLIEHLHLIQDAFGHLSAAHLRALAEEMRLAETEVYEVATFYAHFDVVKEDENPPPPLTVRVCDSLTCELNGARALHEGLVDATNPDDVRVVRAPCMGRCATAPVAEVGHRHVDLATVASVTATIDGGEHDPVVPAYRDYATYVADGGYALLGRCRAGELTVDALIAELDASGLRGLGGAGFPAARKWQFVRAEPAPRYFCLNADEGEPGTFKDRHYLESDPHRVLEGMLIACWAIEADCGIIYLRDEYPAARHILLTAIAALEAAGVVPPGYIQLRRGAGAYICGEESAMLESIEGKRGLPRHKPPFPAQVGLFGRPTLIHNVETVYWLRDIVAKGAAWFADQGRRDGKGVRSFSVSGRVANPGVKIAPAGITARELIDEYCGGMLDGHTFKAYLPGGASGGILPASLADEPLDFGTLTKHGCFVGSHAVVILSDRDDMAAVARNLLFFFHDESCGQCTPCRVGAEKAFALMQDAKWDEGLLRELSQAMADASICGLGQAASNPLLSVLTHFRSEAGLD